MSQSDIRRVFAGEAEYDDLGERDQAAARVAWDQRIAEQRARLNLAAEFTKAGRSWTEADEQGNAVQGTRMVTRQSSDLSRHSADVFADAEDGVVQITRRDGEPLVLMSQREADGRRLLLQIAADVITVTLRTEGTLAARMADRYPWILALSPEDQATCAQNLIDAARASFATEQPHLAVAELTSWRETATAIAAGLADQEVEWLD